MKESFQNLELDSEYGVDENKNGSRAVVIAEKKHLQHAVELEKFLVARGLDRLSFKNLKVMQDFKKQKTVRDFIYIEKLHEFLIDFSSYFKLRL